MIDKIELNFLPYVRICAWGEPGEQSEFEREEVLKSVFLKICKVEIEDKLLSLS